MLVLIFAIAAVFCAVKWFVWRLSVMVLLRYMQRKDVPLPSEAEMREGGKWVAAHLISDLNSRKKWS